MDTRPANDRRRGADAGVDDNSGKAKRIVVQVKSGGVNRSMIATLKGDMEREKAEIGLFVTLNEPTRPMLQEAASAGFYTPETLSRPPVSAPANPDRGRPAQRSGGAICAGGAGGNIPPGAAEAERAGARRRAWYRSLAGGLVSVGREPALQAAGGLKPVYVSANSRGCEP